MQIPEGSGIPDHRERVALAVKGRTDCSARSGQRMGVNELRAIVISSV